MPCAHHLPFHLLTSLLAVGQRPAAADSLPLSAARWVTPVTLTSVTTRHGPGVRLEYGRPCLAEAGTRLRQLRHNSLKEVSHSLNECDAKSFERCRSTVLPGWLAGISEGELYDSIELAEFGAFAVGVQVSRSVRPQV